METLKKKQNKIFIFKQLTKKAYKKPISEGGNRCNSKAYFSLILHYRIVLNFYFKILILLTTREYFQNQND